MFYYGTSKTDNTPIMYDRTDLSHAPQHRAIFGTHGSGRHVLMKSEIVQIVEKTNDKVFVLDFNRNFTPMADMLGGCVIPVTKNEIGCVNPVIIPNAVDFVVLNASEVLYEKVSKQYAIYMCLAAMWEKIEAARKAGNTKQRFWIFIDDVAPIIRFASAELLYRMIVKGRAFNCNITYSTASLCDFISAEYSKAMIENTPIITLLNMPQNDRTLAHIVLQSDFDEEWISNQHCGNGMFCVNGFYKPFKYDQNVFLDDYAHKD